MSTNLGNSATDICELINKSHEKIKMLQPGAPVELQFTVPSNVRIRTTLVGYEKGKYLIIRQPESRQYYDVMTEGNVVVMRFLLEGEAGECVACKAAIRALASFPARLLFMEYPTYVENRSLRSKQRVATHILARMCPANSPDEKHDGVVCDISPTGCKLRFHADEMVRGVNKIPIVITIQRPGSEDALHLNGKVMNQRREDGTIGIGVLFTDPPDIVITLLDQLYINTKIFESAS